MSRRLRIIRPPLWSAWLWLQQGVALNLRLPVAWLGLSSAVLLLVLLLALTPFGNLLVAVGLPFIVAVFMAAARAAQQGERISFLVLPGRLQPVWQPLLWLGLANLLASEGIGAVVQAMAGASLTEVSQLLLTTDGQVDPLQLQTHLQQIMPAMWMALLLLLPVTMATWFAPALILFDGFPTGRALWWSLWACGVNALPMLLLFLLLSGLWVFALVLPFGIGLMIFLPIIMAVTYSSYQAIFHELQPKPSSSPPTA